MKILTLIILISLVFVSACREDIIQIENENEFLGSITIDSQPVGAFIFLHNESTGKRTPNIITNLAPGNYPVTLRLSGYADTTIVKRVLPKENALVEVNLNKQ
jgi:hypothetical protein